MILKIEMIYYSRLFCYYYCKKIVMFIFMFKIIRLYFLYDFWVFRLLDNLRIVDIS